eukprot:TRINITY_DN5072_c0_g1_i2.p1 TRINITY_DN5072_c0_g1~~TRINITY_DN5072_c0_g1_i2.p1  ORF type:complete len:324 (+),score=119.22 TRINITY_DN5072_c0_g1_i2:61-972(+)
MTSRVGWACAMCVLLGAAVAQDEQMHNVDLLQTREVCVESSGGCPCDLANFYAGRCQEFAEHMNASYGGDIHRLDYLARYDNDCMDFLTSCTLVHDTHDEQVLEYGLRFDPCERQAKVATRYLFRARVEHEGSDGTDGSRVLRSMFSASVTLKEGVPGVVLSAPDHLTGTAERADGTVVHYTEYLTVFFKDHWREEGTLTSPTYKKSLHVKLETRYDDTSINNPEPIWRRLAHNPRLQECGGCYGPQVMGCLGKTTALFMAVSLLFSATLIGYTLLVTVAVKAGYGRPRVPPPASTAAATDTV